LVVVGGGGGWLVVLLVVHRIFNTITWRYLYYSIPRIVPIIVSGSDTKNQIKNILNTVPTHASACPCKYLSIDVMHEGVRHILCTCSCSDQKIKK
jgi:hypothetical protein